MSSAQNLRDLLSPLGVYRWEGSFQWGELCSAGAALDAAAAELAEIQREMDLTRAQDAGLQSWCSLLGRDFGPRSTEELRAILAAVLRIHGDRFTTAAAADALRGCGTAVELEEGGDGLSLTLCFPQLTGPGEDWRTLADFLETVLPCHLYLQYRFRSITWQTLEESWPTWAALEAGVQRWEQLG